MLSLTLPLPPPLLLTLILSLTLSLPLTWHDPPTQRVGHGQGHGRGKRQIGTPRVVSESDGCVSKGVP
jgi:hypothetical protein